MRRSLGARILAGFMLLTLARSFAQAHVEPNPSVLEVDGNAPAHAFPHFWEEMFGSGRAILSLRESYRRDLREVKKITGFRYVRFHAILHDEVGVYDEDNRGHAVYNFSYVDEIYDGLLEEGVKPFIEVSFMPKKLAAKNIEHAFWYKQNTSPPKDWGRWDDLVHEFTQHLIERYGIEEVSTWYFEVWNEPNIDFWSGEPKQATYFDLYDHTARDIKAVDVRLRVGGPATAQAAWVDALIAHCASTHVPLDFVSSHAYGDDSAHDIFGTEENIPRERMVCRAAGKVHAQIAGSAMPRLPLIWSEFNATFRNLSDITDSTYMGPWLAATIAQCDGLTDMMSYWTFSDVFEEQGVVKRPFYGGYGLIAAGGIAKPAYNAFEVLHKLGEQRIPLISDSAIATRRSDGTLVVALWNYAAPGEAGPTEDVTLRFKGKSSRAQIFYVDDGHGDFHSAYAAMGSPQYPTLAQIQRLRSAASLPAPERREIKAGELMITLPAHGLAVVEVN